MTVVPVVIGAVSGMSEKHIKQENLVLSNVLIKVELPCTVNDLES